MIRQRNRRRVAVRGQRRVAQGRINRRRLVRDQIRHRDWYLYLRRPAVVARHQGELGSDPVLAIRQTTPRQRQPRAGKRYVNRVTVRRARVIRRRAAAGLLEIVGRV